MPSKIISATAKNSIVSSDLHWTMVNAGDDVSELDLRVFLFDSKGNLTGTEDTGLREVVPAGATHTFTSTIGDTLDPNGQAFIAITRAISRAGIWHVEPSKLELAVKAKRDRRPDLDVAVKYELHARLSDEDRSELFRLAVEKIRLDERNAERINGKGRVFVLRESVDFPLPQLRDARVVAVGERELQQVAVKEKSFLYLTCNPFIIEGSQVFVGIVLQDRAAPEQRQIAIPYRYNYVFTCTKKSGSWVIEKSMQFS